MSVEVVFLQIGIVFFWETADNSKTLQAVMYLPWPPWET
jgi:hypothetical protein